LPRDALQQLAVYRARPWPTPRGVLHRGEAGFVDIDDHNVRVRSELLRDMAHEKIAEAIVECAESIQP
jgi:hypothetical protein